ncbi:MAG: hypothetical protein ACJA0Y_000663 [Maricaulis maris]|jgi:hypothetical protein
MMMATSTMAADGAAGEFGDWGETSLMTLPAREKEARDHSSARVKVKMIPRNRANRGQIGPGLTVS